MTLNWLGKASFGADISGRLEAASRNSRRRSENSFAAMAESRMNQWGT
jgi:hypothetical protein